jgi:hypothetical protein
MEENKTSSLLVLAILNCCQSDCPVWRPVGLMFMKNTKGIRSIEIEYVTKFLSIVAGSLFHFSVYLE